MTDTITLTGLVATVPNVVSHGDRVPFTSFRLASNQRYFDRRTSQWVAADTNWYTVTAFRALAVNAGASVHKGDRVIVTGRLKIRRWETGDKTGTSVDVEADSIGHDLVWGTAQYTRTLQRESSAPDTNQSTAEPPAPDAGGSAGDDGTPAAWAVAPLGSSADRLVPARAEAADTPF